VRPPSLLQEDLKSLVIQERMACGPEGVEVLRMVKEDPEPLYNKLVVQHANSTLGGPARRRCAAHC